MFLRCHATEAPEVKAMRAKEEETFCAKVRMKLGCWGFLTWESHREEKVENGKTMGKPMGKPMGKYHGKSIEKWENHGKI